MTMMRPQPFHVGHLEVAAPSPPVPPLSTYALLQSSAVRLPHTSPSTKMPPRQQHDPFTDAPLRPTHANPALRGQASQQSLRSNTSTASSRTRQQRDLFAPSLGRRPTARSTPHIEDEVLADPDSEEEVAIHRQGRVRGMRQGSPEGKHSRLKPKQEEEQCIVNKQADGSYLLGVSASNEAIAPQLMAPELEAAREADGMLHRTWELLD